MVDSMLDANKRQRMITHSEFTRTQHERKGKTMKTTTNTAATAAGYGITIRKAAARHMPGTRAAMTILLFDSREASRLLTSAQLRSVALALCIDVSTADNRRETAELIRETIRQRVS